MFTFRSIARCRAVLPVLAAIAVLLAAAADEAAAQRADRTVPTMRYRAAFGQIENGEFRDALKVFLAEGRGAIKNVETRWIDSICYYTMCGECYYQMGMLDKALEHYTAALRLFCVFPDWMTLVNFPPTVRGASPGQVAAIPWGQSTRGAPIGVFPSSMLISQGRVNNMDVLKTGGVWQQAVLFPVDATEIVRCTTLALRRRTEIMGPVCRHDPLTKQLLSLLSSRPGLPNHWSEAWIDLQLGLALVAAGKQEQALPHLQRSLTAAGQYDHPLTAVGLFELGRLAMERKDYKTAVKLFTECTYSAGQFFDAVLLEEAFRRGTEAHILANEKGIYPPLPAAQAWAKTKRIRWLLASLSLCLCENEIENNRPREAASRLAEARQALGNREMGAGSVGARLNYLGAAVLYADGKTSEGDAALSAAMDFMKTGSLWRFQIALADRLYTDGTLNTQSGITARTAVELFDQLLADPAAADWYERPMESMAVLLYPDEPAMEHWFETALARKDNEKALEITDRIRRRRFLKTLEFGGRLQSLRDLMTSPDVGLDNQSKVHRQDALMKYPAFAKLAEREKAVRDALAAAPLVAEEPEALAAQRQNLTELGAIGAAQETLLREMAVRRVPCGILFPPIRDTRTIQASLPPGHAVLAFFVTSRHVYAFLLNDKRYAYWEVGSPATVRKELAGLLRDLGHYGENAELTVEQLSGDAWKEVTQRFLDGLTKDSPADLSAPFEELVIVPDDALWYLPFEMLHVKTDDGLQSLIERCNIRYAPTVGLAVSSEPPRPALNTAIAAGRLYPRESEDVAQEVAAAMREDIPGAVVLGNPLPAAASIYSTLFDRLVVLDDIPLAEGNPYAWPPLPAVRGKPGSTLGSWLPLPSGGPRTVVLPGFHTAAENALKTAGTAPGAELFLSLCALRQNGARTVLLSRWRTGGLNAFQFVGEFVEALETVPPAQAYRETVLAMRNEKFAVAFEPRVRKAKEQEAPATHPFFWAAYLLADPGMPFTAEGIIPPAEPGAKPAEKPAEAATPEAEAPSREPAEPAPPQGEEEKGVTPDPASPQPPSSDPPSPDPDDPNPAEEPPQK